MLSAGGIDPAAVPALQRIDIGEMLHDRSLVAFLFVRLVPLVVVVEDEGDDVGEIVDEPVWRAFVDQPVKTVVEAGKVVISPLDVVQQVDVLALQGLRARP